MYWFSGWCERVALVAGRLPLNQQTKRWFGLLCLRPPVQTQLALNSARQQRFERQYHDFSSKGGSGGCPAKLFPLSHPKRHAFSFLASFLTDSYNMLAPVVVALPPMCVGGGDVCRDRCIPAVLFQNKWGGIQCYFNQIASNLFPAILSGCVRHPLVSLADTACCRPWPVSQP